MPIQNVIFQLFHITYFKRYSQLSVSLQTTSIGVNASALVKSLLKCLLFLLGVLQTVRCKTGLVSSAVQRMH
jgi:hypothetical protein